MLIEVRPWRAGLPCDVPALDEAEAILAATGMRWGPPVIDMLRAEHALAARDLEAATTYAHRSIEGAEESRFAQGYWPSTCRTGARVALAKRDITKADQLAHIAMARCLEQSMVWGIPEALETLAHIAADLESHSESARLLGGASSIRERIGWVPGRPEEVELAALAERLVAELGPDGYATARAEGEAMSQDEVVAYVQRGRGERKRPSFGWASLTPAERDVVELVAQGLRNAEIATKLFGTSATVKTHLTHVYATLGVTSRTELAAQAAQRS